jgi:hypothetical protein
MPRYELECETCSCAFSTWRSLHQATPRFCSNACKGRCYSVSHVGEGNPMYGRSGDACPSFGVKRSAETCRKIGDTKRGRRFPKISAALRLRPHSLAARRKASEAHKKAILAGRPLTGFVKKQYVQGWYGDMHFRSSYEFGFLLRVEEQGC